MKILFIQHVSALGGSSRSLLELIKNLPYDVEATVLCPKGKYSELLSKSNIRVESIFGVSQFDNTRLGRYRGLRWLILLRELSYLPFLSCKIFKLKKEKYDIVHINDITQIFSLMLAKYFFGKTVIHARALMSIEKNIRYKILLKIFKRYADRLIAIDESVASTLDESLQVEIIHNGMSSENINPTFEKRERFTVGIVANFQRYKGIIEFIDAANICINERGLDIKFCIYGASYNNSRSFKEYILHVFGFRENLESIVTEKLIRYKLGTNMELKGYVHNADDIYNHIDLHVFPSHLNAAGRPVFEAAFYKIPSIVAIDEPFDDAIIDNKTGICIKEKDPIGLANAIEKLYRDRGLLAKMGEESHVLANKYYNSKKNALEVYELYKKIIKEQNV